MKPHVDFAKLYTFCTFYNFFFFLITDLYKDRFFFAELTKKTLRVAYEVSVCCSTENDYGSLHHTNERSEREYSSGGIIFKRSFEFIPTTYRFLCPSSIHEYALLPFFESLYILYTCVCLFVCL